MKTMQLSRALWGALIGVAATAVIGIAGFAAADMKDHGAHGTAATPVAPAERKIKHYRNPMGEPDTSPTPKKDSMGMDYIPVYEGEDSKDGSAKVSPAKPADRKVKYYRNPMGLPDTSPTPKKDSMGMDYIPVYEGEDSDDGSVKLSPGKIQRTGVKSEPAAARAIHSAIHAPGTIQLDERRVSVIAMRSESYLQKIANVTTGSHVIKGQPLMEVYSPAIASAAAEYISTINSKTIGSDATYGRGSRQRLMNLDVPDAAITAMEKSRTVPIAVEWTSPRDGIVLERNAIEGARAQPGEVLFRIADHTQLWAIIDVAERDMGMLALGQKATVKARGFPGREFTGKINVIYPQVNKETRTGRLRIELANPDLVLIHDMYVDAEIDIGNPAPVLSIPESAVMDTGRRQAVFVDRGEGRFEPREVKLGHRGDGYVEVREGVSEGEPVVISANFLIDAESNLKAALKGFADGVPQ